MPRPTTIYDLTSLQVHADGRRVKQKKDSRPTSVKTAGPSGSGTGGGFRIAKDAGGLPAKMSRGMGTGEKGERKRRKKRKRDEMEGNVNGGEEGKQDGEDFSVALKTVTANDDDEEGDGDERLDEEEARGRRMEVSSKSKSKKTSSNMKLKDRRTIRKWQYEADMDYLNAEQPPTASANSEAWNDFPSSDLLKNIHHFAAQYYSSRGQLYNHAQQVRKAALRRKRKLQGEGDATGDQGEDADLLGEPDDLDNLDGSDAEDSPGKSRSRSRAHSRSRARLVRSGILSKLPPQKGKYKSTRQRRTDGAARDRIGNWEPDMYKMMDGSALVCLGMLMQEYVRWQVQDRIPQDWDGGGEEDDEDDEVERDVGDNEGGVEGSGGGGDGDEGQSQLGQSDKMQDEGPEGDNEELGDEETDLQSSSESGEESESSESSESSE